VREETETTPSIDRPTPGPAENREIAHAVRLRYIGGASVLISGPATRKTYKFSPMQPSQLVDARDAMSMLRTRLFVRTP